MKYIKKKYATLKAFFRKLKRDTKQLQTQENRSLLMGAMGWALYLASFTLTLNQPVWIGYKFLDLKYDIPIYPAFITNYGSDTYLLIMTVILGLFLVKLNYKKLGDFAHHAATEDVSNRWTVLMAICIIWSITGSLMMNGSVLIGIIIWITGTTATYYVDKYVSKRINEETHR